MDIHEDFADTFLLDFIPITSTDIESSVEYSSVSSSFYFRVSLELLVDLEIPSLFILN